VICNVLYLFEDFALDTKRRELRRGTTLLSIEPKVFDLLAFIIRNRERVVSRDDLLSSVWDRRIVSESALTTCINAARSAIADSGDEQRLIKTLPRKGIRFVGSVREEQMAAEAGAADKPIESMRPALALPDKPSIAVLSFKPDPFGDGMADDIITALSRFSELFVIARNSSFSYRDKSTDVQQIGRELGVRYVLQGSIRRDGDRVRISVQLIDATTSAQCWAERYDRRFLDVFDVHEYTDGVPFDAAGHTVTARAVSHYGEPAFGLRVESNGSVLAYSGDSGPTPSLVELSRGADVLICEATLLEPEEGPHGHMSADEARAIAYATSSSTPPRK